MAFFYKSNKRPNRSSGVDWYRIRAEYLYEDLFGERPDGMNSRKLYNTLKKLGYIWSGNEWVKREDFGKGE